MKRCEPLKRADETPSGVIVVRRVHAPCRRYARYGRTLCGTRLPVGLSFASDDQAVTCRKCQQTLEAIRRA